jgi:hypothetical protein
MSTKHVRADERSGADDSTSVDAGLHIDLATCALALARRFASGATLWAVAPAWPEHARHIAVEFVHPVIIGKRAVPAVAIESPDPVAALRPIVAPRDVLVVIGEASAAGIRRLLQRATAWGMTTVWIGVGPRPQPGSADHIVWSADSAADAARHDGSVVRLYHLLWELTHVCLEHSAAVDATAEEPDPTACTTCADEARPAEVLSLDGQGCASVRTQTGVETIDTTSVAPVSIGDLVLVHAGTAIAVVPDEPR